MLAFYRLAAMLWLQHFVPELTFNFPPTCPKEVDACCPIFFLGETAFFTRIGVIRMGGYL